MTSHVSGNRGKTKSVLASFVVLPSRDVERSKMLGKEGPEGGGDAGGVGGDKDKEPPGPKVDLSLKQGEKIKISIGGGSKVSTVPGVGRGGWKVVDLIKVAEGSANSGRLSLFSSPSQSCVRIIRSLSSTHALFVSSSSSSPRLRTHVPGIG